MTEKYKIYIPEDMKTRLTRDAELFEFYKKDGSVNLNAFLKELLVNFFDQYRDNKERLLSTILADLSEFPSISHNDADKIADKIMNTYMKSDEYRSDRSTAITLTVSGRSLDVCSAIENNLLKDTSMSQYINDLFASYLSISRNNREMIIFRDAFETINSAISNRNVITFESASAPGYVFTVRPYMIAASKEEQCNYLLCTDKKDGFPRTFRISRLRAIFATSVTFKIHEEAKSRLAEIAARSPESASRRAQAKVVLTDRGLEKFRLIVKNRPDVLKRDGNTYYFDWPKRALEDYFSRFGKDAIIVSPASSHNAMREFYKKAYESYSE